jgi:hypothetical protein
VSKRGNEKRVGWMKVQDKRIIEIKQDGKITQVNYGNCAKDN